MRQLGVTALTALAALGLESCASSNRAPDARAVASPVPETTSLLGNPLYPRAISEVARRRLEQNLETARAAQARAPNDADSIIWLGRRLAYLERYRDAIDVFSDGIRKHPDDSRLYRHRGHRYITLREFDRAIADLERAAQLTKGVPDQREPDGAPNARGIPTSTNQGNIYYHLALAHYLKADYEQALAAWREAMRLATNNDTRVAVSDWLYMTLRRLGRHDEARRVLEPITASMEIIENHAYHRRLLMYQGELSPDSLLAPQGDELQYVTQGYGVANWYLMEGDTARAREIFDRVLASSYWAAFGYIAAEADVARSRRQ